MKKKTILWILLDLVFLIVFNTVFFTADGSEHPASVWIAYVFIHLSYIMVLATPFLIKKSSSSYVFGFSLYTISSAYFFVEFIVGVIVILSAPKSFKASLIIQTIFAAVYAILLISNLIANETTADNIEVHEQEVAYIKKMALRVKPLIGKASTKTSGKVIEQIYDEIHSSPSKSPIACAGIEKDIYDNICELESLLSMNDDDAVIIKGRYILSLIDERNRILKALN